MAGALVKFNSSPEPDGCIATRTAIELVDAISTAARKNFALMVRNTACLEGGGSYIGSEEVFVKAVAADLPGCQIVCWSPRSTALSRDGAELHVGEEFTLADMPERVACWLYPAITGMSEGAREAFALPAGRQWVSPGALFMPCLIPPPGAPPSEAVDTQRAGVILEAGGKLACVRVDVFFWMSADEKMAHGPPHLRTHPPFVVGEPVADAVGGLYLAQSRFLKSPYAVVLEQEKGGLRPAERRRRHRRGEGCPAVHTVTLRRIERVAAPQNGTEPAQSKKVDWSCRWDVSPHWRRQWYPGAKKHSPVLIAEYEKGPPDKPKREKRRTVYKATR